MDSTHSPDAPCNFRPNHPCRLEAQRFRCAGRRAKTSICHRICRCLTLAIVCIWACWYSSRRNHRQQELSRRRWGNCRNQGRVLHVGLQAVGEGDLMELDSLDGSSSRRKCDRRSFPSPKPCAAARPPPPPPLPGCFPGSSSTLQNRSQV